jgi:tetratricopeptide (TPR) repeat protein
VHEAFDLYWHGLGGYKSVGRVLGENPRGLRILERFIPRGDFTLIDELLPMRARGTLVNDVGLYAMQLGDLATARGAFAYNRTNSSERTDESITYQNLAAVELNAGFLLKAIVYAETAVSITADAQNNSVAKIALTYRAKSGFALGKTASSATDFQRATELEGQALYALRGIDEAECKFLCGDHSGSLSQTHANLREYAIPYNENDDRCRANALLSRLLALDDPAQAARHLQDARAFANRSGHVELQLRCAHAATELYTHLGDYTQAIAEADAGILLADTCGFGKYSIDIRLALAETYLAAGDARKALQNARNALDRSEHPDCQYAWGRADGLHSCGVAHRLLGEKELARQRLTAALELRERLGHGRIEETRRALATL